MFIIHSNVKGKIKIKYRLVSKVLKFTIKCKKNYNNFVKNAFYTEFPYYIMKQNV